MPSREHAVGGGTLPGRVLSTVGLRFPDLAPEPVTLVLLRTA